MGFVFPKFALLALFTAIQAVLAQHVAVRYSTLFRLRDMLIAVLLLNLLAWTVYAVFVYPRFVSPLRNVPCAKVFS